MGISHERTKLISIHSIRFFVIGGEIGFFPIDPPLEWIPSDALFEKFKARASNNNWKLEWKAPIDSHTLIELHEGDKLTREYYPLIGEITHQTQTLASLSIFTARRSKNTHRRESIKNTTSTFFSSFFPMYITFTHLTHGV